MSRFINPFTKFTDNAHKPLSAGRLYFYETGTNVEKQTYSDPEHSTPNDLAYIELSGTGVIPDVWYNGNARVVLADSNGDMIDEADPVSASSQTGQFTSYSAGSVYSQGNIVELDGAYYISNTNNNTNNPPGTASVHWTKIVFLGEYNPYYTYSDGDVVFYQSRFYESLQDSNTGNTPSSSSDFWLDPFATTSNFFDFTTLAEGVGNNDAVANITSGSYVPSVSDVVRVISVTSATSNDITSKWKCESIAGSLPSGYTNGQIGDDGKLYALIGGSGSNYAIFFDETTIREQKMIIRETNSSSGTFVGGAGAGHRQRRFNTTAENTIEGSQDVSANEWLLPAGKFLFDGFFCCTSGGLFAERIYNSTLGEYIDELTGTSADASPQGISHIKGYATFTQPTTLSSYCYVENASAVSGSDATPLGVDNIYAALTITKVG